MQANHRSPTYVEGILAAPRSTRASARSATENGFALNTNRSPHVLATTYENDLSVRSASATNAANTSSGNRTDLWVLMQPIVTRWVTEPLAAKNPDTGPNI